MTASESDVSNSTEKETTAAGLVPKILVIDDDQLICQQLKRLYTHSGYSVETSHSVEKCSSCSNFDPVPCGGYDVAIASSAEKALERLKEGDIDLVITDIRLPAMSGIDLTRAIQEIYPDVPVIVITGHADISNAVEVLKLGASDYIVKPFGAQAILESTRAVLEKARVFTEIRHLRLSLKDQCEFGGMLSKTPEMHRVFETIRMVSATDMTVLVEGETGTGKELVANAIHCQSSRCHGPFVPINCSGFPESLLESELFGYERGAFTGAYDSRAGKIEQAQGGTLFIDEVESISLAMQAKLLRVLEDRKIQRLGGNRAIQVDTRVIAASNVFLKELVAKGDMRRDFYYRINVIPIYLIPLRQRLDDIPLLVQDFLHHHPVAAKKRIHALSKLAMRELMEYSWPGNIRELQNVLERAMVLTSGRVIEEVSLPEKSSPDQANGKRISPNLSLQEWLDAQEKEYLAHQLILSGWKIGLAAKNCGVNVKTLYRKMIRYGLRKIDLNRRGETYMLPFVTEAQGGKKHARGLGRLRNIARASG